MLNCLLTKTCGITIVNGCLFVFTSKEFISSLKAKVKGHARPTGASNIYDLNGPQLSKWIRGNYADRVVSEYLRLHPGKLPLKQLIRIRKAAEWMKQLHDYLLHSRTWTPDELVKFAELKTSWSKRGHKLQ